MVLVEHWQAGVDKLKLPQHFRTLARDSYDNCLAYLDERLGELFDELQRRGELDRTLVVVTADHGEGLGEHDIFDHGESLYRTETRVPLLIVLPSRARSSGIVAEPVSLRDLPATIVDLAGLTQGSPFPGRSLAGLWRPSPDGPRATGLDGAMSELPQPEPVRPEPRSIASPPRTAVLPSRGRLRLYPQRGGWEPRSCSTSARIRANSPTGPGTRP